MPFISTFTQTVIPSNIRAFAPLVKHNNTNNVTLFIDNTFRLGILNTGASPSISYDNTNQYFDLFTGNTTTYLLSAMTNLRPTPTPTPSFGIISGYNLDLDGPLYSINLRSIYQQRSGDTSNTPVEVTFNLKSSFVGSNNTSTPAIDTGEWPAGSVVNFWVREGARIVGAGGAAGVPSTQDLGGNRCGCRTYGATYCCNNGMFGRAPGQAGGNLFYTRTTLNVINDSSLISGSGGGGGGSIVQTFVGGSQYSGLIGGGGGGAGSLGGQGCNLGVTCCTASELAGGCANRGWWKSKSCGGGNGTIDSGGGGGCMPYGSGQGGGGGGAIGGYGGTSATSSSCDQSNNGGAPGYVYTGPGTFTYYSNTGQTIYGLIP